ncbi:MAG: hypothetical protein ACODAE_07850, partial [Gemmatimonadota bacterium]
LVHLLVLAIASRVLVGPDAPSEVAPPPGAVEAVRPDPMQAIELTEVAAAEAPEARAAPEEPAVEPEPEPAPQPTEVAEPPDETDEVDEPAARPPSPAERLRPRMGDPRLWAAPSELAPGEEPSAMDRARGRVAGEIDALNDSVAAAIEAQRRSREWIVEDDDGGRWGISPGDGGMPQLHLGDIAIPLPFSFPVSPEVQDRMAEWNAIQGQVNRQAVDDFLEERAEAMRERADRRRRDGDGDGGSDTGGSSDGSGGAGS